MLQTPPLKKMAVYNQLRLSCRRAISVVISASLLNAGVNLKGTCAVMNLPSTQGWLQRTFANFVPANVLNNNGPQLNKIQLDHLEHQMTSGEDGGAGFALPPSYSHSPANSGKSLLSTQAKTHRWGLLSGHTLTLAEYEPIAKWATETS